MNDGQVKSKYFSSFVDSKCQDKIIDSESCVNVREWCARVNMGDRLLSMLVRMCAVCVFEQCEICNKRLLLTQDRSFKSSSSNNYWFAVYF